MESFENENLPPMPCEEVRNQYAKHYVDSFENAKLLMRRPFGFAKENNLGLYNDIIGKKEGSRQWLDWIENGGEYTQTGEKNALVSMKEFWKTAPSGGELASSVDAVEALTEKFNDTKEVLLMSHTTFIGPKTPLRIEDGELSRELSQKVLLNVGYRLGITQASFEYKEKSKKGKLTLTWENSGVAPLYFNNSVYLYVRDESGAYTELAKVDINLTEILPGEKFVSKTSVPVEKFEGFGEIYLAIVDKNKSPFVSLVSNQNTQNGYALIIES